MKPLEPVPFISRVRLKNFKSIAECDVRLGPLTLLVGANATGKSVFLDALRFVQQAIGASAREAIEHRGGIANILRQVPEPSNSFEILLEVTVPWGPSAHQWAHGEYGFEIAHRERPGHRPFTVVSEHCRLEWQDVVHEFRALQGRVEASGGDKLFTQTISDEELYLPNAAASTSYGPLFAALRGVYFYAPDLATLRSVRPQTRGEVMGPSGEHLGDVLAAMEPATKERFQLYMQGVIPDTLVVDRKFVGQDVTVGLWAPSPTGGEPASFGPDQISDGTIRAAGLLAALFQPWVYSHRIRLVAVEEPETALHPAAAGVLFDALTEASERVQIIATTQSPDLLDRDDADPDFVRVFSMKDGVTHIGEVDAPSREIVRKNLATTGQLLRGRQLRPMGDEGQ